MSKEKTSAKAVELARDFLKEVVGQNIDWDHDPHVKDTPMRFARMITELTTGHEFDSSDFTTFDNGMQNDEMVIVAPIPFTALCAHHVIPFSGHAYIGYIPTAKIAGLSKFARAVKWWSHGLWTQENLTDSIAIYLEEMLEPLGLGVVMQAEHMCMTIRGIQAPGVKTITSAMKGVFLDPNRQARNEFLTLAMGRRDLL